jgi:sulfonate transport system substrate-binding protein
MRARIASLSLFVLLAGLGPAVAKPVLIRGAWVAIVNRTSPLWMAKKDLAVHYGKTYIFKPEHFVGTPTMITALANNQIEIGDLGFSTLPIAVDNAGLMDLRVIADDFQDAPGYHSTPYMVLRNGPVHTIANLKGKVVATNAEGAAVDITMKAMLRRHGLRSNRDYTEIEAPFSAMTAMLAEHKADLVPEAPPFVYAPELKKIARPLFNSRQAIGPSQFIMLVARDSFIKAHRAALVDFLEDTTRIDRWYMDPKNHAAIERIMARLTHRPATLFSWVFTKHDFYRSPDMLPNLAALQKNVDLTYKLGFVKAKLNVKAHADLSLVKEAAARLK